MSRNIAEWLIGARARYRMIKYFVNHERSSYLAAMECMTDIDEAECSRMLRTMCRLGLLIANQRSTHIFYCHTVEARNFWKAMRKLFNACADLERPPHEYIPVDFFSDC